MLRNDTLGDKMGSWYIFMVTVTLESWAVVVVKCHVFVT